MSLADDFGLQEEAASAISMEMVPWQLEAGEEEPVVRDSVRVD